MARDVADPSTSARPPLQEPTVGRDELLVEGSDREFRRLVHGLFAFFARHEAIRDGHARRIGLAGVEYTVLIAIARLSLDGEVSVKRVGEHLHVSGAFITTVSGKLARKGLISKRPSETDRRRVRLEVTRAGYELLNELAPYQRRVNDVEFGSVTRAEFRQLVGLVERLIVSGDEAIALQRYLARERSVPRGRRAGRS
ncbi:MAG: MarR family transcriptional regulator [Tistlia sp.]|uniref:MarR family winged helix-turn-helix transcriptional regulator n=1 Tax=Tistlia sp. TaxID=3057121 RepID=UPI0034A2842D